MFQAEVRHVIAQGVQEMIAAVMPRPEQRAGLLHQVLVLIDQFRADFQGPVAVGGQVQVMLGAQIFPEIDGPVVRARRDRRIDQRGKRSRLELHIVARFPLDGQRRAVAPAGRDLERRLELHAVGVGALRIQQHLIPVEDR
jgi:hypothetical protein